MLVLQFNACGGSSWLMPGIAFVEQRMAAMAVGTPGDELVDEAGLRMGGYIPVGGFVIDGQLPLERKTVEWLPLSGHQGGEGIQAILAGESMQLMGGGLFLAAIEIKGRGQGHATETDIGQ